MTSCLDHSRLQAVADGEGTAAENQHARTCDICGTSVASRRATIRDLGQQMSAIAVPERLSQRIATAVSRRTTDRAGATTLRAVGPTLRPRPAWVFAGGAVAALLAMLFVVLPSFDSGTSLNASAILGRSIQTLERRGIERLEYELSVEGPAAVPVERGTYRIEQLIDHESGRWRFARYASDGTILNGISEDPVAGTRETVIRHEGRTFRFTFAVDETQRLPLWSVQRRLAEAMIRVVQASSSHVVTEEVVGDRRHYVVGLSDAATAATDGIAPLFDLARARIVVDAADYHIVEFSAGGTLLGEELAIGYRLIRRVVTGSGEADFALPRGDEPSIEMAGTGTQHVPADVLTLLLETLANRP